MKFVLSTMTMGVNYCFYQDMPRAADGKGNGMQMPVIRHKIHIAGGAGLPSGSSGFGNMGKDEAGQPLWTPSGIVTSITDEQYEQLQKHSLFMAHVAAGWLRVVDKDLRNNHGLVEKEVRTMAQKDGFSQIGPGDKRLTAKAKAKTETLDSNRI